MADSERPRPTTLQLVSFGLLGSGVVALLLAYLSNGCTGPSPTCSCGVNDCSSSPDILAVWELVLAAVCLATGLVLALKTGAIKTGTRPEKTSS